MSVVGGHDRHHVRTVIAGALLRIDLANRKALVLGLGDTGLSLARWLASLPRLLRQRGLPQRLESARPATGEALPTLTDQGVQAFR